MFSIGSLTAALISLITLPIMTWYFTPANIGRFTMLNLTASFATLFFSIGMDQAFIRWFNESKERALLFKMSLLPGFSLLLVMTLGISFNLGLLSEFIIDINNSGYGLLIVTFIILSYLARFFPLILRMNFSGGLFSICQVLPKLMILIVLLYLCIFKVEADVKLILIMQCLSAASILFFSAFVTFKYWKDSLNLNINKIILIDMLKFSFPLILGSAAFWALTAIDKLFIKYYISLEGLAIYTIATNIAGVAVLFQSVFSTVWTPLVYKWNSEMSAKDCVSNINNMINIITLIACMLICGVGLLSWALLFLFPKGYESVPFLVVSCLIFPLFYALSEVTVVGINIAKKTKYSMYASVITVLLNLLLNYILIPMFGVAGAAISSSVSAWGFMVLRTELSVYAWKPVKRKKMYFVSFFILTLSLFFTIFGKENGEAFIIIWTIAFLGATYVYYYEFKSLIVLITKSVIRVYKKEVI